MDFVLYDAEGMRMRLTDADSRLKVDVFYDGPALYYDEARGDARLGELRRLMDEYGEDFIEGHTFFVVRASSVAKKLDTSSYGMAPAERLRHIKIVGEDCIVDVVALFLPAIRFVGEGASLGDYPMEDQRDGF